MRTSALVSFCAVAFVFVLASWRYAPPAPLGEAAAGERFSAVRARDSLASVVADGAPRPIGSLAAARAREELRKTLERLGWRTSTQKSWTCHEGTCANVENVVATLDGAPPNVLLSAHYDSTWASPGATDDGMGLAAILETARALTVARPRHGFVVLLSDGEEDGLLGADAFVREHPAAANLAAVINVDARGSSGPSALFEVHHGGLVALAARRLERPVTSSFFYEIYRSLPNDTDFTVEQPIGQGFNFANFAKVENYHTEHDDLAHLDLGTLQHHGDHVLGMARALDDTVDGPRDLRAAVWFDVLAVGIVHFPASFALPLALLAFLVTLVVPLRARIRDRGLLAFPVVVLGATVASAVAGEILRLVGATPFPWIAHPLPSLLAVVLTTFAGGGAANALLARKSSPRAMWAGTWVGWSVTGLVVATIAPGASYLFAGPALVAGVVAAFSLEAAMAAGVIVAAVLFAPIAVLLYPALGIAAAPLFAAPFVFLLSAASPLLPTPGLRRFGWPLAAALACAGLGAYEPVFSTDFPQRANVVFRQIDGEAKVFATTLAGPRAWGPAPRPMLAALGTPSTIVPEPIFPWEKPSSGVRVPSLDTSPPEVALLSTSNDHGRHRIRIGIRSTRGATSLALVLPTDRDAHLLSAGAARPPIPSAGGALASFRAVGPEGVVIELDARGEAPIALCVVDIVSGVPRGTIAEAVARARSSTGEAVMSHAGDVTVVGQNHRL